MVYSWTPVIANTTDPEGGRAEIHASERTGDRKRKGHVHWDTYLCSGITEERGGTKKKRIRLETSGGDAAP